MVTWLSKEFIGLTVLPGLGGEVLTMCMGWWWKGWYL